MKRFLSIMLVILSCLLLFSCGEKESVPEGMQKAKGDDASYSLYVPAGWTLISEGGMNGAYYSTSDKSSVTVSSFFPEDEMYSIEDYWNASKESYAETYKNFELLEENVSVVFGGKAAFKYVFGAEIDKVSYKFLQIVAVHGNMFYTFTYTSTEDNYELHIEDVEKTISEFVFN